MMGPRPLLTPRLSVPGPLPSPESCRLPGRLALWNRVPQGQPRERPRPSPFDRPCPAVVRPRNKEEMEALEIQVRRDWRFQVNISPPRGQAAAWERPASAGGVQGPRRVLEGDPGTAPGEKGSGSREPSTVGAGPGRAGARTARSPAGAALLPVSLRSLCRRLLSWPLWAASCSVCPVLPPRPDSGGLPSLLGILTAPRPSHCRQKDDKNTATILGATTVPNTS